MRYVRQKPGGSTRTGKRSCCTKFDPRRWLRDFRWLLRGSVPEENCWLPRVIPNVASPEDKGVSGHCGITPGSAGCRRHSWNMRPRRCSYWFRCWCRRRSWKRNRLSRKRFAAKKVISSAKTEVTRTEVRMNRFILLFLQSASFSVTKLPAADGRYLLVYRTKYGQSPGTVICFRPRVRGHIVCATYRLTATRLLSGCLHSSGVGRGLYREVSGLVMKFVFRAPGRRNFRPDRCCRFLCIAQPADTGRVDACG